MLKYLGWMLEQSEYDCPAFLHDIWKARQVWGKLGKLLQIEGAEPAVSEIFHRAVVQAVLLFGAETWVLLAPMAHRLEGAHVGFLWHVTRKRQSS